MTKVDTNGFAGIYMPESEDSDWDYIDVHDDGTFHLYGKEYDVTGWIGYDEEFDAQYAYNDSDGSGSRFYVAEEGRLYFAEYGYFSYTGMDNMWYDEDNVETTDDGTHITDNSDNADNSDDVSEYYSWNAELYQRNVSELEGIWYYDGELSAERSLCEDAARSCFRRGGKSPTDRSARAGSRPPDTVERPRDGLPEVLFIPSGIKNKTFS